MLLRLENLDVFYGNVQALWSVSIDVPEGAILALLGANGAGKSTLLKTVSGLTPQVKGRIEFQGRDITRLPPEKIVRLGIIHCPEGRRLFPQLTVMENLKMGGFSCRHDKKKLREFFERVMEYFPRLKQRQKQRAGSLSGGEQQMLAIGRALMASPQILLLDEPSMGLSPILVAEITKVINDISKGGIAIFLVEQNSRLAFRISQRGYVLETGQIVLQGYSKELIHNEHVRMAYLGK